MSLVIYLRKLRHSYSGVICKCFFFHFWPSFPQNVFEVFVLFFVQGRLRSLVTFTTLHFFTSLLVLSEEGFKNEKDVEALFFNFLRITSTTSLLILGENKSLNLMYSVFSTQ